MSRPRADRRFAGCLVGQCVGDAVGFPVEGAPAAVVRAHADAMLYGRGEPLLGRASGPPGQVSDDSQLARALMESMVARRGFDAEDYAGRIATLFAEGRVVGGGWATAAAAERIARGVPWEKAATPPPDAGNGSAMRAAPIGLFFHDDPERLVAAALEQGRITHADPRCGAGWVAIAGAVALALTEAEIDATRFLGRLAGWVAPVSAGVAGALSGLVEVVSLPSADARPAVIALSAPDRPMPDDGLSPFVTATVLWSLYAFLRSPADYVRAVHTAISVGGDVDTTGAMTGAIAGARNGLESVPFVLADRLTDRGDWPARRLVALADRLWLLKATGPE